MASAAIIDGYTVTHPHNPYEGLVSVHINRFADGEWQAQIMAEGALMSSSSRFATEVEAVKWALAEMVLWHCVRSAGHA